MPKIGKNDFEKLPEASRPNEELSLDFAGPFQNVNTKKKCLLVSVDILSAWPDGLFVPTATTEKVIELLVEYISTNGIPKQFEQIREQRSKVNNMNYLEGKNSSNM